MTTHKPIKSAGAPDASEPLSPAEKLEEDASLAAVAATGALRAIKVAAVVLIGLLVCPPLAVLVFTVVAPFLAQDENVFLFHHFHARHGGHLSLLAHRLRLAARAVIDLAPHRIVADARKMNSGR